MKKNENGFSAIEILLIIIIVGLVGISGWYIWNSKNTFIHKTANKSNTAKNTPSVSDSTFEVTIDPMVGGGFVGEVNTYTITATGEVYNSHSPKYDAPITRTSIKKISEKEVQELRASIIDSGVLGIAPGDGPHYGGSSWKITINGHEKSFFDQSSPNFTDPKIKLKKILGDISGL